MHVVGRLPRGVDDGCADRAAAALRVTAPPLSFYCLDAAPRGGLLLGYTDIDVRSIRDGVRRLGEALTSTSLPEEGMPRKGRDEPEPHRPAMSPS